MRHETETPDYIRLRAASELVSPARFLQPLPPAPLPPPARDLISSTPRPAGIKLVDLLHDTLKPRRQSAQITHTGTLIGRNGQPLPQRLQRTQPVTSAGHLLQRTADLDLLRVTPHAAIISPGEFLPGKHALRNPRVACKRRNAWGCAAPADGGAPPRPFTRRAVHLTTIRPIIVIVCLGAG